jgi:hypothetical protein
MGENHISSDIPYSSFGSVRLLNLRKHTAGLSGPLDGFAVIILDLNGPSMSIIERISRNEWAVTGSLGREGENPKITEIHGIASAPRKRQKELAINVQIRAYAIQKQSFDKGFDGSYFNPQQVVTATVWVEKGLHGEYGWAVFMRQGNHRCTLTGCLCNRPEEEASEDAAWKPLTAWSNMKPVPNMPKTHEEGLFLPVEFTHAIEPTCEFLGNIGGFPDLSQFSGFHQGVMNSGSLRHFLPWRQ